MRPLRVVVALLWLAAATAPQAFHIPDPVGQQPQGHSPEALLSECPGGAALSAARTRPSPNSAHDPQSLAFRAFAGVLRPSPEAVTADRHVHLLPQFSALAHLERGPPLAV